MADEIGVFTPEQARMLWQDYLTRSQLQPSSARNMRHMQHPYESAMCKTCVLDTALDAPTNGLTAAETAEASVVVRNSSGNLVDAGYNITVVNRSENIDLAQYTLCVAMWVDGEWRIIAADCDALGDWP